MVNVPSRAAQARLVGVKSRIYEGHFRLVADLLNDPVKAYDVIERASGRAAADVLRTLPADAPENGPADDCSGADNRPVAAPLDAGSGGGGAATAPRPTVGGRTTIKGAEPGTARRPPVGGQRTSAKALQQALANDELLLEYVLTEPQSYCLVIGRTRIRIAKLPSKGQIEPIVDRFTQDLKSGKSSSPTASKELYDAILAPIPELETARRAVRRSRRQAASARVRCAPGSAWTRIAHSFSRPVGQCVRFASDETGQRRGPQRALMGVGGVPYDRMFSSGKPPAAATRSDGMRGLFDASYPTQLPVLPTAEGEVLAAARVSGPDKRGPHRRSGDRIGGQGAEARRLRRAPLCRPRVRRPEVP